MIELLRNAGFPTVAALLLFTTAPLTVQGFATIGNPSAPDDPEPVLDLTTRSAEKTAGSLRTPVSTVEFTVLAETPARAVSTIRVNGLTIDATVDLSEMVVRLEGNGGRVSPEDRTSLRTLSEELERRLTPYDKALPIQEAFLVHLTAFLAEAPAGLRFFTHQVTPRGLVLDEGLQPGRFGNNAGDCQQADPDGIAFLSSGCNLQGYDGTCYDTASSCFQCSTVTSGCSLAAACPGRCGVSCGLFGGRGAYTRDCAEHDDCCSNNGDCFNPFSLDCGDEYWEAADDFLWGRFFPNCAQGCS